MKDKKDKRKEQLDEFMRQAWLLSDEEIDSFEPGKLDQIDAYLANNKIISHPFSNPDREDIDNPHLELLKIMRTPEFFPFTCKHLFNMEILPCQQLVLMQLWYKQFPMLLASRGFGKSFMLAVYCMLRLIFCQGSKIVITAAAFRQAKIVFEYMEGIWSNAAMLRGLVASQKGRNGRNNGPRRDIDRCEMIIGDSICVALPLGNGDKIRGMRAHYVICEEFAKIPEEIYATVIGGFGAVSANPIQNVKGYARQRLLKNLGYWTKDMEEEELKTTRGNQSVISGTADYSWNHFCKYWKIYKSIIESRGNKDKLEEIFMGEIPDGFDYRDYSIMRFPYELIPKGYMDAKTVSRAKQTSSSAIYLMEYSACFANDSDGFFKRSLIEKCVCGTENISYESCGLVNFGATLVGNSQKEYVFAIDPASESDRFAIAIIELWPDHRRLVYVWTTTKSGHREKLKRGIVRENDFYRYGVAKIRELMDVFPCVHMMIDAGGGGIPLREAFRDGPNPIYEVIDHTGKVRKDSDDLRGLHLIELVQFRDNAWVVEANHGLRKDMEDRKLLFPRFSALEAGMALEFDEAAGRVTYDKNHKVVQIYDTLEDCMSEIEDLKTELTTIVVTQTMTGLERWDTPETKGVGGKKGRLRKDRYSALLMANMGARIYQRGVLNPNPPSVLGGFAASMADKSKKKERTGQLYSGPAWWTEDIKGVYSKRCIR